MPENHNIEDFFKKRLENHDLHFQEEDWLLLEKRLLSVHPSSSAIELHFTPRTILIITAALTAAFFLGWMASELFQGKSNKKFLPSGTEQNHIPSVNTEKFKAMSPNQNHISSPNSEQNQIENMNRVSEQVHEIASSKNLKARQKNPTHNGRSDILNTTTEKKLVSEVSGSDSEQISLMVEIIPLNGKIKTLQITTPFQSSPPFVSGFDISPPQMNNIPVGIGWINRWSIGLILAPDYNGVRLFRDNTATAAIGGILTFQFTSKWSVSVRVIYNNKKYSSEPHYYKLPEGYWISRTNGIMPENIHGSCRVIDLPVMATFQFLQRKNISLFASAGLGNYFMLDEKYDFEFNQSNPGADTQWQTQKNSTVLFGTANIALGVGFQTTPRINVAFEPYLKIPIKEIGWGNVNLYSMGLSLTMKYRL